jgi:hypothetical protein
MLAILVRPKTMPMNLQQEIIEFFNGYINCVSKKYGGFIYYDFELYVLFTQS